MGILRDVLAEICTHSGKLINDRSYPDSSSDWLVASYKDKDDFAYLWGKDFLKWVKFDGKRNVVVVWDGVPDADGRFDYITPVYWAMALSYRLLQGKKGTGNAIPELRIFICDVSQQSKASAFCRALPDICEGVPWLRIYRPTGVTKDYWGNFECLIEDIKSTDPTFSVLDKSGKERVALFVYSLTGSITKDGLKEVCEIVTHRVEGATPFWVKQAVSACQLAKEVDFPLNASDELEKIATTLSSINEQLGETLATVDRKIASLGVVCSAKVFEQLCTQRIKLVEAENDLTQLVEGIAAWRQTGQGQEMVKQLAVIGSRALLVFKNARSALDLLPEGRGNIEFPQEFSFQE